MRRHLILAASLLFLPFAAVAQRHAAMPAPRAVASAPRPAASGAIRPATPQNAVRVRVPAGTRGSGNVIIINNNNRGNGRNFNNVPADFVPVPGLGFDMVHLAATRGAASVGALPGQGFVSSGIGFGGGEFFIPSVAPTIVVEVPPVVVEQPAAAEAAPVERPAEAARSVAGLPAPREEMAPARLREESEYVFVQRDGALFFAVAYSWENGRLHYVTKNGLRRTILKDQLDIAATEQFNEQRGLSFRAPA